MTYYKLQKKTEKNEYIKLIHYRKNIEECCFMTNKTYLRKDVNRNVKTL